MRASGISTGFPVLSRSSGQVAHVLLTRSPLGLRRCCHRLDPVRLACIKHAASVRPEPGSNSPSRLPRRPRRTVAENQRAGRDGLITAGRQRSSGRARRALRVARHCFIALTHDPGTVVPEPPALAFGSRSSVFKERPGTHPSGVDAKSPRTDRDEQRRGFCSRPHRAARGRFGGTAIVPGGCDGVNAASLVGPGPGLAPQAGNPL